MKTFKNLKCLKMNAFITALELRSGLLAMELPSSIISAHRKNARQDASVSLKCYESRIFNHICEKDIPGFIQDKLTIKSK